MNTLTITITPHKFGVYQLPKDTSIPNWAMQSEWFSITKTDEELSIICPTQVVPASTPITYEGPWRALKVLGPLDFALVGILARLAAVLAAAEISIFAISTYDTDYLLVKEDRLSEAVNCLLKEGYIIAE